MEGVRKFLETTTIHGLSYIATTRKYARVFWLLVVIGGFTCASYLIYESFQSWAVSPIKTTLETLPMSDIRFPKLTVCPPKNTFTDLNFDMMLAEKYNFTDKMREELFAYAVAAIDEISSMN